MNKLTRHAVDVILRLVLYQGEVYCLPKACRKIRVRSGLAWVSFTGQDIVLACGEEAYLRPDRDFAVVSAVGHTPLVLEILGADRQGSFSVLGSAINPALGN
jgi:hypothetical protein